MSQIGDDSIIADRRGLVSVPTTPVRSTVTDRPVDTTTQPDIVIT